MAFVWFVWFVVQKTALRADTADCGLARALRAADAVRLVHERFFRVMAGAWRAKQQA